MSSKDKWISLTEKQIKLKNEQELFKKYLIFYQGDKLKALLSYSYGLHLDPYWEGYQEFQMIRG